MPKQIRFRDIAEGFVQTGCHNSTVFEQLLDKSHLTKLPDTNFGFIWLWGLGYVDEGPNLEKPVPRRRMLLGDRQT